LISEAAQHFRADVQSGKYPSEEESYHLPRDTRAALESVLDHKRVLSH
jgi:hypothetical protein